MEIELVITNLNPNGFVNFNILKTDEKVSEVNPGGLNEINELHPFESYAVKCDQSSKLSLILRSLKSEDGKTITLKTDEEKAVNTKTKPSGVYYYLSVVPQMDNEELCKKFEKTKWDCVDTIVIKQKESASSGINQFIGFPQQQTHRQLPSYQQPFISPFQQPFSYQQQPFSYQRQPFIPQHQPFSHSQFPQPFHNPQIIGGGHDLHPGGINSQQPLDSGHYGINGEYSNIRPTQHSTIRNRDRTYFNSDTYGSHFVDASFNNHIMNRNLTHQSNIPSFNQATVNQHDNIDMEEDIEDFTGFGLLEDTPNFHRQTVSVSRSVNKGLVKETDIDSSKVATIAGGRHIEEHGIETSIEYNYDRNSCSCVIGLSINENIEFIDYNNQEELLDEIKNTISKLIDGKNDDLINQLDKIYIEKECCICMDDKPDLIFYQCGHQCCHYDCAQDLPNNRCPLCRNNIKARIKINTD